MNFHKCSGFVGFHFANFLGVIVFSDHILFFNAFRITPVFNVPGKLSGKTVIIFTRYISKLRNH